MDRINKELLFKDEAYQIVGAAFEVSNNLGCGFLEATELPLGIVINFGNQKLEWRRFANTEK